MLQEGSTYKREHHVWCKFKPIIQDARKSKRSTILNCGILRCIFASAILHYNCYVTAVAAVAPQGKHYLRHNTAISVYLLGVVLYRTTGAVVPTCFHEIKAVYLGLALYCSCSARALRPIRFHHSSDKLPSFLMCIGRAANCSALKNDREKSTNSP